MARRTTGTAQAPLFAPPDRLRPLADRMRPRGLDEVVGQDALLGPGAALRRLVEGGRLPSCILWGPPGSGKTTIGRLLAEAIGARFAALNSTTDGVAALRGVVEDARGAAALEGRTTVVFLDEVHRYSKAQQDALLPHVEAGTIVLVGATTEPPIAGGITPPLLSRLRVFRLQPLGEADLATIATRALADADLGLAGAYTLAEAAARQLVGYASGDARRLLGLLETAAALAERRAVDAAGDATGTDRAPAPVARPVLIESADIARAAQSPMLGYDRSGVISALIKSIRGSDPDAALWWLATALESGEDPRYVARRLVISASEDIGNAEPAGLPLAVAALTAVEKVGAETNDEGLYALAQTAVFLAASPKSAAAGRAFFAIRDELRARGPRPVPGHLRPAAKTYRNPHDVPDAADQAYLPRGLAGRQFWDPTEAGAEARLGQLHRARLEARAEARRQRGE